jgi:O-antigen chain-terminating methyltransferase
VAQRAATAAARELDRMTPQANQPGPATTLELTPGIRRDGDPSSYKYVAFEDLHRGSSDEIRARLADYVSLFADQGPVLEIGCGRGEFLELLRAQGIEARGVDSNDEMVQLCRERGLDVERSDALSYLTTWKPGSLGGFFAAQVVEHLEPAYLLRLLDTAGEKLRPNGIIVLETINPTCWVAFFESYIRDPTHVRPLHPDTLEYLLLTSGFSGVDVRFRSPVAPEAKLQTVPGSPGGNAHRGDVLDGLIAAFNANVQRLNERLFTYLDYAVIARKA